ncbi:putative pyruvate formate-lyase activating enzyme [Clostridia bacterium]|nr:putative pyruvate formate-lyase activating enzyme [Clostridia bacterium]
MGILFNIQRFSLNDGPGIRTTIFFKGCNLYCKWCHNPESIRLTPQAMGTETVGEEYIVDEVMKVVERDMIHYKKSGGGVTFSGGEPTVQFDFLTALAKVCRARGIHTCLETNGIVPREKLSRLIGHIDLFLIDYKLTDDDKHKRYTGSGNRLVIDTINYLNESGAAIYLRCPIIPGINDDEEHFTAIRRLKQLDGVLGAEIMPYHEIGVGKWEKLGIEYELAHIKPPSTKIVREWEARIQ